jgi:hypothetical protein
VDIIYNIIRQAEDPIITRKAILKKDKPNSTNRIAKPTSLKDICDKKAAVKLKSAPLLDEETIDQDTIL